MNTRLEDAKVRYKDKPLSVWSNEEKANHLIDCALGIEKQVMENCKISPKDINDESIKEYIIKLKYSDQFIKIVKQDILQWVDTFLMKKINWK